MFYIAILALKTLSCDFKIKKKEKNEKKIACLIT